MDEQVKATALIAGYAGECGRHDIALAMKKASESGKAVE